MRMKEEPSVNVVDVEIGLMSYYYAMVISTYYYCMTKTSKMHPSLQILAGSLSFSLKKIRNGNAKIGVCRK